MRISDWSSDVCSSDLIAEYDCLVVDDADDAFAHGLVDPRWPYEREPAILSRLDDRCLQRLLAAALEAGGDSEQILLLEAVGDFYCDDRRSEEKTAELQSLMRITYALIGLNKKKKH